jgi:hypothetical protein
LMPTHNKFALNFFLGNLCWFFQALIAT